jgi:hypothetical protein
MLPYSFIGQGTYTNGSSLAAVNVALSDRPDWFFVKDLTNWGAQSTAANPIYSEWFSNMAAGSYLALGQPSNTGASVTTYSSQGTSNGFTFINPNNPPTFASLAATAINNTTYVVSMADTGSITVGDTVRVINPTAMLQVGGLVAQVTAVTTNTSITLGYVATGQAGIGAAASATAATILKFYPGRYYPRKRQVIRITKASQAKIYFSQPNDFTPGEMVDFSVPSTYGMTQLNYLTGQVRGPARVLTVTNSATESSITIDVDSSGFTTFAYPTSANTLGAASPPVCVPAGSGVVPLNGSATVPQSPPGTNLQDAFDNLNQYYMSIGTSACGVASATMQWFAFKADYSTLSNA